jgi:hypothetical protein
MCIFRFLSCVCVLLIILGVRKVSKHVYPRIILGLHMYTMHNTYTHAMYRHTYTCYEAIRM